MPHAHAEPQIWIIRVYGDGKSYEAGDPYELLTVARLVEPGVVELAGMDKRPTKEQARAIRETLMGLGLHAAIRTRRVPGRNAVRVYRRRNGV